MGRLGRLALKWGNVTKLKWRFEIQRLAYDEQYGGDDRSSAAAEGIVNALGKSLTSSSPGLGSGAQENRRHSLQEPGRRGSRARSREDLDDATEKGNDNQRNKREWGDANVGNRAMTQRSDEGARDFRERIRAVDENASATENREGDAIG